jgi:hypothetical protein
MTSSTRFDLGFYAGFIYLPGFYKVLLILPALLRPLPNQDPTLPGFYPFLANNLRYPPGLILLGVNPNGFYTGKAHLATPRLR